MKAHFHITVGDVDSEKLMLAAKLIGAKCTTIDLHRDTRSQRDRMLTKYQKGIETDKMLESVSLLTNAGFKVLRFKLEQMYPDFESLLALDFDSQNYGEVHIKTDGSYPEIETNFFRISSNAEEVDYRFYNARLYDESDKQKFVEAYQKLLYNKVPVRSFHLERTVFDSFYNFDSWWA